MINFINKTNVAAAFLVAERIYPLITDLLGRVGNNQQARGELEQLKAQFDNLAAALDAAKSESVATRSSFLKIMAASSVLAFVGGLVFAYAVIRLQLVKLG